MDESIFRVMRAISEILDGNIHGAWLYGSVVLDDFRPGWSDIDMIVLTDGRIAENQARELLMLRQDMSAGESENPYYRCFEGIIANLDEYRANSFRRLVCWGTTGQRITDRFEPDAFSRFELARYGRPVWGTDDRSPFIEPSREEMVAAIQAHCSAIRQYAVQTDERLYSCGWLLDIARCIYTLRYNDIIAKTRAGVWALNEHLFPDEAPLLKTVEIRRHPSAYREREDVKQWLRELGPVVQRYADVLERELRSIQIGFQHTIPPTERKTP